MARPQKPRKYRPEGPYLDAALICEEFVQEKDWAITPVRSVNRITFLDDGDEKRIVCDTQAFALCRGAVFKGSRRNRWPNERNPFRGIRWRPGASRPRPGRKKTHFPLGTYRFQVRRWQL